MWISKTYVLHTDDLYTAEEGGGGKEAVPVLIIILGNYRNGYKLLAAIELGRVAKRTGDKRAVIALVEVTRDSNSHLRERACETLADTGDPRAVEVLVERLGDRNKAVVRRAVKYYWE